jgi:hypothetical protein
MPNNIEDHLQLAHFTELQLYGSINTNNTYDLQRMFSYKTKF